MINDYYKKQEGFEPNALRKAIVEFCEKWAKEFGYTLEEPIEDLERNISCKYKNKTKGTSIWIYDMSDIIHINLPPEVTNSFNNSELSYSLLCFHF